MFAAPEGTSVAPLSSWRLLPRVIWFASSAVSAASSGSLLSREGRGPDAGVLCVLCMGGVGREKSLRAMASCLLGGVEGRTPRADILGSCLATNQHQLDERTCAELLLDKLCFATGVWRCYSSPANTHTHKRENAGGLFDEAAPVEWDKCF